MTTSDPDDHERGEQLGPEQVEESGSTAVAAASVMYKSETSLQSVLVAIIFLFSSNSGWHSAAGTCAQRLDGPADPDDGEQVSDAGRGASGLASQFD